MLEIGLYIRGLCSCVSYQLVHLEIRYVYLDERLQRVKPLCYPPAKLTRTFTPRKECKMRLLIRGTVEKSGASGAWWLRG